MSHFKSEYKAAVDRLEPSGRLLDGLKSDLKAAIDAPPKGNFFVRYRWAFGSAAACLAVALAVGVFLSIGRVSMESSIAGDADGAVNGGIDIDMSGNMYAPEASDEKYEGVDFGNYGDAEDADRPEGYYPITDPSASQPETNDSSDTTVTWISTERAEENVGAANGDDPTSDNSPPFSLSDMPFDESEIDGLEPITDTQLKEWAAIAEQGLLTYGDLERCAHVTKLYKGLYTMGCLYRSEETGQSYVLFSCYFVQSARSAPAYAVLREISSGNTLDLLHDYSRLEGFMTR